MVELRIENLKCHRKRWRRKKRGNNVRSRFHRHNYGWNIQVRVGNGTNNSVRRVVVVRSDENRARRKADYIS